MDVTFSTGEGDAVGVEVASFGDLQVLKCKIAKLCVRNGTKRDHTWLMSEVLAAEGAVAVRAAQHSTAARGGVLRVVARCLQLTAALLVGTAAWIVKQVESVHCSK